jgi:hypothetical protein
MRFHRRAARALVALGLAAGLSACAFMGDVDWRNHEARLTETQLRYAHFLRWGEYDAASFLVEEELRESFRAEIRPFAEVRLADYEVLDTQLNPARTEATVMVSFSAYHLSRLIEHRWTEKQVWTRDVVTQEWQVKPDIDTLRRVVAELQPAR